MLKLYTGDVVAATSSKGNQEKWFDGKANKWYKVDTMGFEALAETAASRIFKLSNIERELGYTIVPYSIEKVAVHKKEKIGCVSKNFLATDEELITLSHLLKRELGKEFQKSFRSKRTIGERMKALVDTTQRVTGLDRFGEYLTLLFEADALILNEDRHLNNIAVIYSPRGYSYCPLFDNGASFLLDIAAFPLDVDTKSFFGKVTAKPFQCTFTSQVSAARKLYGRQLKISIDKEELLNILRPTLEFYPKMYRGYLMERMTDVIITQKSKLGL